MKKPNEFVRVNGNKYKLGSKLGGGLEGNVFNIESDETKRNDLSNYVIKIIDDSKMSDYDRDKVIKHLKRLKSYRDDRDSNLRKHVILPAGLLDDEVGYIMRNANEHESLNKYIDFELEGFSDWYKIKYPFKKRMQIIVQIFEALKDIHYEGLIFSDLSPSNIMVHKSKNNIVFIDCDNMRDKYDIYSSVLGTPGYMAPEKFDPVKKSVSGGSFQKNGKISVDSDVFSAAIICFELLMLQHPFVGDVIDEGSADEYESAKNCNTDFIFKKGTTNFSTNGLTHFYDRLTTPEVRNLFYRTFVDGKTNPALRPTAIEFYEAFSRASNLLVTCNNCGFEQLANEANSHCCDCDKTFEEKVVLEIYNTFGQMDMAEAINNMGEFFELNVDINNILINDKQPITKKIINRIVFDIPHMTKMIKSNPKFTLKKILYLFDFEGRTDRSEAYAKLEIKDLDGNIELTVEQKYFANAQLINIMNKQYIPLSNGKSFKFDNYGIIFDTKPFGKNGTIIISGKFVRE